MPGKLRDFLAEKFKLIFFLWIIENVMTRLGDGLLYIKSLQCSHKRVFVHQQRTGNMQVEGLLIDGESARLFASSQISFEPRFS